MHFNSAKHPILYSIPEIHDLPVHPAKKSRTRSYANPNTDILESKDAYKAIFQLPGVSKENISINFENNALTLQGKVASPKVEEFKTHIKQIASKPYKKSIEFPTQVDYENITADYTNGLLTVLLPKSAKQHKSISIL
ncbi:HSP20-like chaperone [Conidiobolus coronatus NRRL 28638]|uniref:HSP20-like chaperone n=1 Tax=Conidiobolus coronatus (strain ATCC 28846 / CBS 209.66 / NRRL 28638) TaxID=796925 RepID=A0A137P6Z7_CONC2|nr:HSP20-like chaperone [Conidiobolus coronatus NRRL 28638]|eukprot:KXN70768.1 HSP20-like chaperone [Conidiobolus coronatus NRRL 28638]